jgi:hypothetical protein
MTSTWTSRLSVRLFWTPRPTRGADSITAPTVSNNRSIDAQSPTATDSQRQPNSPSCSTSNLPGRRTVLSPPYLCLQPRPRPHSLASRPVSVRPQSAHSTTGRPAASTSSSVARPGSGASGVMRPVWRSSAGQFADRGVHLQAGGKDGQGGCNVVEHGGLLSAGREESRTGGGAALWVAQGLWGTGNSM